MGLTEPNAWGRKDMVGNVSEWTRSSYRSYPCVEADHNDVNLNERKVARGGSSAVRRAYVSWQKVYDVGFRVIIISAPGTQAMNHAITR